MKLHLRILSCLVFTAAVSASLSLRSEIVVNPYLQKPRRKVMTILWWTSSSEPDSKLLFGERKLDKTVRASNIFTPSMKLWLHEADAEGLKPKTEYLYKVVSGKFESPVSTFKTAPPDDGAFTFAVLGDGRTDNPEVLARHRRTASLAVESGASIIIEAGDIVKSGSRENWLRFMKDVLTARDGSAGSSLGASTPYLPVVGNHEIYSPKWRYAAAKSSTMSRFKSVFANFANGASNPEWEERYYAFDYGPAAFIVLDANNDSDSRYDNNRYLAAGSTPDWSPGSPQYKWMIRQLERARKTKAFTFVFFHPSPYSSGVHGAPSQSQSGYQLRVFDPVFRKYGVDAVFTSHDHIAARSLTGPPGFEKKMDAADPANLNWFVTGNAGEGARFAAKKWKTWMSVRGDGKPPFFRRFFYSWAGKRELTSFLLVTVKKKKRDRWKATFEIMRSDGKRFDKVVIIRACPGASSGRMD